MTPDDFVVDELPLFAPSGVGTHTMLRVEKRLANTEEVARALARGLGVSPRDIGYAGRKDRAAVTRQWFSAPDVEPERALALDLSPWLRGASEARVLEAARHGHKLRTGQLRGNRFALRLRGVDPAREAEATERVERIARHGFPNRFGEQRFGRGGGNLALARDVMAGKRAPGVDKRQARFLVSALQAAVFNEVLASRPLPLDRLEVGDIAIVHASGGPFFVEDAEVESERASRFEISPSGPIFGTRRLRPEGAPAEREAAAHAALGLPPPEEIAAPPGIKLKGARRSLRARPEALSIEREGDDVWLRFELESGCYATVLIEAIFGAVDEGPARDAPSGLTGAS